MGDRSPGRARHGLRGGRYDGLVELLGGKPTPAVGFAIGMERLLDLWEQSVEIEQPAECEVYIVHQGEEGQRLAARVGEQLRDAGLDVIVHAGAAGFKAQFKRADASGARIAVILAATKWPAAPPASSTCAGRSAPTRRSSRCRWRSWPMF